MSVTTVTEVNRRLRAAGITVHEAPGWKTRGNGYVSSYEGGLVHHTATGFGKAVPGSGVYDLLVNGRPDLRGPLCNYAGNDDGSITVIAAHPANHAGASGGRSMGPLPTTSLFNRRVLGLEIVYPGTTPMRAPQYRSALVWARVVADVVGGGNIERIRAHAETSITGKWDPGDAPGRTINMAAFRDAATTILEDDLSWNEVLKDGDQWEMTASHAVANIQQNTQAVRSYVDSLEPGVAALRQQMVALQAAIAADKDIDSAALEQIVNRAVQTYTPTAAQNAAAIRPALAEVMREVITDEQADEILRKLGEKLAATEGN